ncbi:hypothetical protein EYC98_01705 [Halieaceae bacterium IMCC14734]|uniref:Uncharacterized protein n=1 Tax=Candidatus Litorirhabdus singularis TaxID=2518993 RepID=A0ABT3TBD0_9GAMM|nr:hypothetical protein [Candidatus Litorirhabdus singularis]MCX2979571.1 hypothetical protein [Candidatus Litorirhabdus singularis]
MSSDHSRILSACLLVGACIVNSLALAQTWEPYTGENKLRALMSDAVMEGSLPASVSATARYYADGTAELKAWGETIGRPWKLGAEINYYVDQPDAFGPQRMFGINVTPVVENVFARMFQ